MFLKPSAAKLNHPLNGATLKQLKKRVRKFIPEYYIEIHQLLDSGAVFWTKLVSKCVVYTVDGLPILFSAHEKDTTIYPCLYALWKINRIAKCGVGVPHPVSKNIASGADIMLPGVFSDLSLARKDKLAIVYTLRNPFPVAVGVFLMDYEDMKENEFTGKGVRVLHHYSDELFALGDKEWPEGFRKDFVYPLQESDICEVEPHSGDLDRDSPDYQALENDTLDVAALEMDHLDLSVVTESEQKEVVVDAEQLFIAKLRETEDSSLPLPASELVSSANLKGSRFNSVEHFLKQMSKKGLIKTASKPLRITVIHRQCRLLDTADPNIVDSADIEEMEFALNHTFIAACKAMEPSSLPIPASTFFSRYMTKYTKTHMDLRKTRFKKLSKFVEEMSKDGLVSLKTTSGELCIISINMEHPDIVNASHSKVVKKPVKTVEVDQGLFTRLLNRANLSLDNLRVAPTILQRFKPDKYSDGLFKGAPYEDLYNKLSLYTLDQAKSRLFKMITETTVSTGKGNVTIEDDSPLLGLVSKSNSTKKDLVSSLHSHLKPYYSIQIETPGLRGPNFAEGRLKFKSGSPPSIEIVVLKKIGRKVVTQVEQFEVYGINASELGKECSKAFAASATTRLAKPEVDDSLMVVVQGDVAKGVAAILNKEYGIPPNLISVTNKAKPKKKKKK